MNLILIFPIILKQPNEKYKIIIKIKGGGKTGQSEAILFKT